MSSLAISSTLAWDRSAIGFPQLLRSHHRQHTRPFLAGFVSTSGEQSPSAAALQLLRKHLLQLVDLGPDDDPAVALAWVVGVIVLMIIFRPVELGERGDLGHDRSGK